MKQRVPVSQIMSKDIITIAPTQTLYEAEALFKKHNIRHIPVVEGHKLIGVLSLTDLLRISFADLSEDEKHVDSIVYDMFTIPQVMAKVPLSISPDTTIKEAAEILAGQTFHSLPVTENGSLVGMLLQPTCLSYLLEQY